jgi:hypothetical protein
VLPGEVDATKQLLRDTYTKTVLRSREDFERMETSVTAGPVYDEEEEEDLKLEEEEEESMEQEGGHPKSS